MDFDHFDSSPDGWRACEEPMVEHVARSAPVNASRIVLRVPLPRISVVRDFIERATRRWLLPVPTAPPALI